ncbi:MAG: putative lipid II flippase FtsW [Simkaniaceae bacterium]|nr:putative lipid II flippase FtsW [Simkaniaceae bacterium]MCF7852091.1 putative lipid II flippase FtsW [Simkaniaceae bacterium]
MNRLTMSLFALVLVVATMGLLMVYNTTSAEVIDKRSSLHLSHAFLKQLGYGVIGGILAWSTRRFGYEKILKFTPHLLILFSFLLLCTFLPGIGLELNGAKRWIRLFGFSFQPSEFVKIILPLTYIRWMQLRSYQIEAKAFIKSLIPFGIPLFLILIEPDNGSVAILIATMVVVFFLCRVNWRYWCVPILAITFIGGVLAMQLPYVKERLKVYINPEHDLLGKGHQPFQAKIAAGTGGLTGRGIGKSLQKLSYLPEARSDYIAAIYAEEFGFIGMLFLSALYMSITLIGFLISIRAKDREGALSAATLAFLFAFQAFINLGVVSGLLPSKGTNLPLFSHGGTSLIANLILIAILIDIGMKTQEKRGVYAA